MPCTGSFSTLCFFLAFFGWVAAQAGIIPEAPGFGAGILISNLQRSQCLTAANGMLSPAPPAAVSRLVGLAPCNLTSPLQTWEINYPTTAISPSYVIKLFGSPGLGQCISTNGTARQIILAPCARTDTEVFLFQQYFLNGLPLYVINNPATNACLDTINLGATCPNPPDGTTLQISNAQLYEFRLSNAPGTGQILTVTVPTRTLSANTTATANSTVIGNSTSITNTLTASASTTSTLRYSFPASSTPPPGGINDPIIYALIGVSGLALLSLIAACYFIFRWRRKKAKNKKELQKRKSQDINNLRGDRETWQSNTQGAPVQYPSMYGVPPMDLRRSYPNSSPPGPSNPPGPSPPPPPGIVGAGMLMHRNTSQKNSKEIPGTFVPSQRPDLLIEPTQPRGSPRQSPRQSPHDSPRNSPRPSPRPDARPRDLYSEIDGGEYHRQQMANNQAPFYAADHAPDSASVLGGASAIERLRGDREAALKHANKPVKIMIPVESVISEEVPSPTSTDGEYIHSTTPVFVIDDTSKHSAGSRNTGMMADLGATIFEEDEGGEVDDLTSESGSQGDALFGYRRNMDALSQRSSSLGFPIQSKNMRSKRLNTTGPASIFDVLSEAGVDVRSGTGSVFGKTTSENKTNSSASTATIIHTITMANAAAGAGSGGIEFPITLYGSPSSVVRSAFPADDDVDSKSTTHMEIATVIWSYESQQQDELDLKQGDLIIIMNRFDDGWGRGWSKRLKRTGFFPVAAVTLVTTDSDSKSVGTGRNRSGSQATSIRQQEYRPSPLRYDESEADFRSVITEEEEEDVEDYVIQGLKSNQIKQNRFYDLQSFDSVPNSNKKPPNTPSPKRSPQISKTDLRFGVRDDFPTPPRDTIDSRGDRMKLHPNGSPENPPEPPPRRRRSRTNSPKSPGGVVGNPRSPLR